MAKRKAGAGWYERAEFLIIEKFRLLSNHILQSLSLALRVIHLMAHKFCFRYMTILNIPYARHAPSTDRISPVT